MQSTLTASYSGDLNSRPSSASLVQVVAAAATPQPTPTPTTPATPRPTTSSKAQLTALGATLARAVGRGGLAALTRSRQTFNATEPGALVQSVTAKNVLLASARRTFAAAGKATFRLTPTAAGRRAMRRGSTLKLTIVSRFTPRGGTPVVVTKRLTVKRPAAATSVWRVTQARVVR